MALTTQQKYDEAVETLHKYSLGQAVLSFRDQNGEQVQLNTTTVGRLRSYIATLERALGIGHNCGPVGFFF